MKLKMTTLAVAGALFGAAALPAQANNEAMMDLLKVLRDQGTITEQNYELLVNAAKADKEEVEAVKADVAKSKSSMPKITTKGKIKISDAKGNWSFQPIGRVMYDYLDVDDDDGDSSDDFQGTELRRARLGFVGKVYNWGYKFEADFAKGGTSSGEVSIKDAYVSYGTKLSGNKFGVKLGQSHVPFGLQAKMSSKYMSFMDRPMFSEKDTSPARKSGVVASLADPKYKWTLAAGYQTGSMKGGSINDDDNTSLFAVRGSFVPFMKDKKHLLQIGAGYMNGSDDGSAKFDNHIVAHKDSSKNNKVSISSGDFDGSDAFTVDALGVWGSFHALAQYVDYEADSKTDDDFDVDGFSIEAGYFLTGESLKWKKGYTSGIAPKSKSGAWQVAARFQSIDIEGENGGVDDEIDSITLGVNYYPTQNTRLMLNYDHVTDWSSLDASDDDRNPSALKFRAQAYW